MRYMLDTNICIYIIRGKPAKLLQKVTSYLISDIAVSSITVAELQFGVQRSNYPQQNQLALNQFLVPLNILDFDYDAAAAHGVIRANLEAQGTQIGSLDTLIAAHALSKNLALVTNNIREFSRVSGLLVEDWSTS
jgi:tRNA(fMet)-specific endonuclease VapC